MSHKLNIKDFNIFLDSLKDEYKIFGPVIESDGGALSDTSRIKYSEIQGYEDLQLDGKSYFSPKEILYPIRETLMYFTNDGITVPKIDDKKYAIFLRPCDLNGIKRLDTIFLENGNIQDFYYKRMREKVKFFVIECTEGFDTCFCVSMDSNKTDDYDLAFRFGDEIKIKSQTSEFSNHLSGFETTEFDLEFIKENKISIEIPPVDKVTLDIFEDALWTEYTQRCINCGRCNTSCITCSCFTMQDITYDDNKQLGERRRRWAGCHVNGFTDMAGGHTFRSKNGDRMRFKAMHKINDYHKRFGHHMCIGCGRCDDVCPEYISFSKCITKINEVIKKEGK